MGRSSHLGSQYHLAEQLPANFVDSILSASNSERFFEAGAVETLKPVAPVSQRFVDNK